MKKQLTDRIAKGKTQAIIAGSLVWVPYKLKVRAVADRYAIPILEDSAEALGGTIKKQNN
jgi:dTDP-4-amino-4,6-dideoxygalactose transaminase